MSNEICPHPQNRIGPSRPRPVAGLAVAVLAVAALSGCGSEPTWTEFEAESGRFTVEMPGDPEIEDATAPTPDGELDLRIASVELDDAAFAVSETAFPEGFPVNLPGAADGTVANSMQGSITSSRDVDIDGMPCLRFGAAGERSGQDVELESIVCHVDNLLVQLIVVNDDDPDRTDRFIESLRFDG